MISSLGPLPEPWHVLALDRRAVLERQLARELAVDHPLFGLPVTAVAECGACDSVVFAVDATPPWWVHVHLTWSQTRQRVPYPRFSHLTWPLADSLAALDH
jgi:hypothetical protein